MATTEQAGASPASKGSLKFLLGIIGVFVVGGLAGVGASFMPTLVDTVDMTNFSAGDTAWVLAAASLVMIMTPAVGFFYGGMVRSKNVVSVIKQSIFILAAISIQWVLFGYSIAFGGNDIGGFIGDLKDFGLAGVGNHLTGTIPEFAFVAFQAMFAIITPALIIGAFVERIRFSVLIVFTVLWSTLVYDPLAHWVWHANGWLFQMHALDFAGGTVIHVSSGFAALAAALVVGKRIGFKKGEATEANNVPFVLLGAAILWFGWFGFNAGSALAANTLATSAFVVTNTAAAAAALVWLVLSWVQNGRPSALATATGAVCGLVAITPASGFVSPMSSIAIGIIGGLVTYLMLFIRSRFTSIDDTLDVWAAHGMGGVTGALLTGVFAETAVNSAGQNGLLFGNPGQLGVQALAVVVAAGLSFVVTLILLFVLKLIFGSLRVTEREEALGLDLASHGEEGYRIVPVEPMPEPELALEEATN